MRDRISIGIRAAEIEGILRILSLSYGYIRGVEIQYLVRITAGRSNHCALSIFHGIVVKLSIEEIEMSAAVLLEAFHGARAIAEF